MVAGSPGAWQENIQDTAQQLDALNTATGLKADAAVIDPTLSASEIAILKGIMTILAQGANAGAAGNVSAALGGFVDGAIVTLGLKADAAWSGSGSGTAISILKKIKSVLDGVALESGGNLAAIVTALASLSVTANAGTNLNTSALAKESGGNLDAILTDLDLIKSPNSDNITLLASAAITANSQSADQTNSRARGLKVFVATGSFGASESTMTVTIEGKDPVSGTYYTILQSASLSASTFTVLSVYPGLAASANVAANDVLPKTWRVKWNASNWGTGGSTLGISAALIV
jgi:hypothetical protein